MDDCLDMFMTRTTVFLSELLVPANFSTLYFTGLLVMILSFVFVTSQAKSIQNRRSRNNTLRNVDEAKEIYQERSKWSKVVSDYPCGKEA